MQENDQNFTEARFSRKGFAERLRMAIPEGVKLQEVSNSIGVSLSGLKKWLSEDADPSMSSIAQFSLVYGVSLDWLIHGRGEMRPGKEASLNHPDVDQELLGRCSDSFASLYKDLGITLSALDLGRLAAEAYNDVVVAESDEERRGALKVIINQHRKRVLAEATANSQGKLSAS